MGPKTQGPMPEANGSEQGLSAKQTLEEAVGEELDQRLLKENMELKEALLMRKGTASDSWSDVTPPEPTAYPKVPMGKMQITCCRSRPAYQEKG